MKNIKFIAIFLLFSFTVVNGSTEKILASYEKTVDYYFNRVYKNKIKCSELSEDYIRKLLLNDLKIKKASADNELKKVIKYCDKNLDIFSEIDNSKYYRCFYKDICLLEIPHIVKYFIWKGDAYRIRNKSKKALESYKKAKRYIANANIPRKCSSNSDYKRLDLQVDYMIFAVEHPELADKAETEFMANFNTSEDKYELLDEGLSMTRQKYLRLLKETEQRWTIIYYRQTHLEFYDPILGDFRSIPVFGEPYEQFRQDIDKETNEIISFKNWEKDSPLYNKNLMDFSYDELVQMKEANPGGSVRFIKSSHLKESFEKSEECKNYVVEKRETLEELYKNELLIKDAAIHKKWDKIFKLAEENEKIFRKNVDWDNYISCLLKNRAGDNFTPSIIKYIIWQGDVYRIKGEHKKALNSYNRALDCIPENVTNKNTLDGEISPEEGSSYFGFLLNYLDEYCNYLKFIMDNPELAKQSESIFLQASTDKTTFENERLTDSISFRQYYLRIFENHKNKYVIIYAAQPAFLTYRKSDVSLDITVELGQCSKRTQYRQEIDKKTNEIKQCSNIKENLKTYCEDLSKMECPD